MEVEFPALLKNVVPVAVVTVAAAAAVTTTMASATLASPSALRLLLLLLLLPVGVSPVLGILVGAAVRILVLVGSPGVGGAAPVLQLAPATTAVLGARATASEGTLTSALTRAA